jgi:hypothetical protein
MKVLFVVAICVALSGCAAIPGHVIQADVAGSSSAVRSDQSARVDFWRYPEFGDQKVETYLSQIEASRKPLFPPSLRDDPVVHVIFALTAKALADAETAARRETLRAETISAVEGYEVPALSYSDVKAFAKAWSLAFLRPKIVLPSAGQSDSESYFSRYFAAYYQGNYIDRLGQPLSKPSLVSSSAATGIAITLTDADISAALSALIDFGFDMAGPMPVIANSKTVGSDTLFYPAKTTAEPTVLLVGAATVDVLGTDTGGINECNVGLLSYLPNAAGDEAALVTGIGSQSFGGFGVSAGVFGKVSLGDNQTLGVVVKTIASRLALRSTLLLTYLTLKNMDPKLTPCVTGASPLEHLYLRME